MKTQNLRPTNRNKAVNKAKTAPIPPNTTIKSQRSEKVVYDHIIRIVAVTEQGYKAGEVMFGRRMIWMSLKEPADPSKRNELK